MASNEAKVIITAQDKTKSGISSAEKSLGSFGSNAKKLGVTLAAVFATKKIIDFGADTIMAFADAEAKMVVFNQTLKNMGMEGIKMRDRLLAASNMVTKFGFDNEDAAVAMARFAKMTGDVEQAIKLNQLTMDIASAKGINYAEAADTVTRALNGQFRGLIDLGFKADESKTALENLNEVQKQIAGITEEMAGTPLGALKAFQSQWNEIKEAIGGALWEGLKPFSEDMNKLVMDPMTIEFFKALAQVIGGTLKFAISLVTGAIGLLSDYIYRSIEAWTNLGNFLRDVWMAIWDGVTSQFKVAVNGIQSLINKVYSLIDAFKQLNIVQGAKNVGGKIINSITGLFKADGGPVSANNPYIVGEQGPELFVPNSSGSIIPNGRLAGAGNITINITGNTLLDGSAGDKLAAQIMKTLKQNLRI